MLACLFENSTKFTQPLILETYSKPLYLAHMFRALVNVVGAIIAGETGSTLAFEVGKVIEALPAVLAPIWRLRAKWDLCLAVLALKLRFNLRG